MHDTTQTTDATPGNLESIQLLVDELQTSVRYIEDDALRLATMEWLRKVDQLHQLELKDYVETQLDALRLGHRDEEPAIPDDAPADVDVATEADDAEGTGTESPGTDSAGQQDAESDSGKPAAERPPADSAAGDESAAEWPEATESAPAKAYLSNVNPGQATPEEHLLKRVVELSIATRDSTLELTEYKMYRTHDSETGEAEFPNACRGCEHYGTRCPIFNSPTVSTIRNRIQQDSNDSPEEIKYEYRNIAERHGCKQIPEIVNEWETRYSSVTSLGWELYQHVDVDIGSTDIETEALEDALEAVENGEAP